MGFRMLLKHFLYINWGNIPTIDFELGPVNLFSGGNGSGKTTAADATQTFMTAAHETESGRNTARATFRGRRAPFAVDTEPRARCTANRADAGCMWACT
jgi:uncharacterized protein YPO0396